MKNNIFNQIKVMAPKSNTFNLSHDHKLTGRMGKLIPFFLQECYPADKFNLGTEALIRFAPLIAPVMHKVDVYFHYFFVPNRILWKNWEYWINKQDNEDYTPPYIQGAAGIENIKPILKGSVGDYFGLPVCENMTEPISALPFAAYQRIFQEYYQDQNNDNTYVEEKFMLQDGPVSQQLFEGMNFVRSRAWEHDYFTSALPFAQKGEAVNIPLFLSGFADISYKTDPTTQQLVQSDGTVVPGADTLEVDVNGFMKLNDGTTVKLNLSQLQADLNNQGALSGTINDLRRAMALQRWLELNARAGTRYAELLRAHFGTSPRDERLQRPEYIGGSKQPVIISEVLQTSNTVEDVSPQANMAGHGVSAAQGNEFSYYCQEHGWIIGIMSVMPTTAYFQGIPRHFSRLDQLDYYWPQFANIGEQEIRRKEIFYQVDEQADNNQTFGYIPRYAELRFSPSRVSGDFRDSLRFWHLGRYFENTPQLNREFISCDPSDRIFAVQDENEDNLWCHIYIKNYAQRALPLFGTPAGL